MFIFLTNQAGQLIQSTCLLFLGLGSSADISPTVVSSCFFFFIDHASIFVAGCMFFWLLHWKPYATHTNDLPHVAYRYCTYKFTAYCITLLTRKTNLLKYIAVCTSQVWRPYSLSYSRAPIPHIVLFDVSPCQKQGAESCDATVDNRVSLKTHSLGTST